MLRTPPRFRKRSLHVSLYRRIPLDDPELAGLEVRLEGGTGGASGERRAEEKSADVRGGSKEEESRVQADVLRAWWC